MSGQTVLIFPPYQALDAASWSAGLAREGVCFAPDESIYLSGLRLDASNFTILDFQDPNQANQVTGYNVYRSSNIALPFSSWQLVKSNVVDMDEATANNQWVDSSGDASPSGVWYYDILGYNAGCDAEGPR